ncbi:MAG TPA: hypothetical protein VFZ58_00745 [Candidatus Saccharimonadales bacterium]
MAHKRKKRSKTYAGSDAKVEKPTVHRYTAVERSKLGQWWHDHGKTAKRVGFIGGGGIIFIYLIVEGIRLLFR